MVANAAPLRRPLEQASWGDLPTLADAAPLLESALDACIQPSVSYAEARVVECDELRHGARLDAAPDYRLEHDAGIAVRVLRDGVWGFASRPLDAGPSGADAAVAAALGALSIAAAAAAAGSARLTLPPEIGVSGEYGTEVASDPFAVAPAEIEALLVATLDAAAAEPAVRSAEAEVHAKRQHRYLASTEGARQAQHLVECGGGVLAVAVRDGEQQRRSYPNTFHGGTAGAGFEYVRSLRLAEEAGRVGEEAAALCSATQAPAGTADLVIGPAQLSLQIHESVGHALELDRILGDERNFAGTSFVGLADIGTLRYGSEAVTISADPTAPGTRGTFAFDDEGTPARRVDLVESGVLREVLSHRDAAARTGRRTSGAARSDGYHAPPVCFATNVFLQPGAGSLDELLDRLGEGYYLDDNRSWSIDHRRLNFQFGTEAAWEVRRGRRTRLLRGFSYGGMTPVFWGSVEAVAGPSEFRSFGFPCGKGEPKQWGFLAHGASPALVRQVAIGVGR